jgi:hypothetical protein
MNEDSIPAELHYTLSSASPYETLCRVRAAFERAGTETGLVQEGTKHYYAGSYGQAHTAFVYVAGDTISPMAVRKLKVAIGDVVAIACEQLPERLHTRRLSDYSVVISSFSVEDASSKNEATQAGEVRGPPTVSPAPIALAKESSNVRPSQEPEAAAAEARRQWKSRFRVRVKMMEKLLANAPDDNVPTPRGDGDD